MPAQPLLDPTRLQRDARTDAARAGRARLEAERRRIQASRDVMTVLDMLEASSSAAGIRVEDPRVEEPRGREQPTECDRVLVVLFVHNISPLETL